MGTLEKIFIGALGGFSAVLVKFLGQDFDNVVSNAANFTSEQLLSYQIGYGILTPILMFLGAFVAWVSDEEKRIKIVALAIAAPAMVTTWSGGAKSGFSGASLNLFFPAAYAEDIGTQTGYIKLEATQKGTFEKIKDGIGTFFGYDKQPDKYWVIVGSYQDRQEAQNFADAINTEDDSLNAYVGFKGSTNEYYPVIVGQYSLLSEAKVLKEKALKTDLIEDAYLSIGTKE